MKGSMRVGMGERDCKGEHGGDGGGEHREGEHGDWCGCGYGGDRDGKHRGGGVGEMGMERMGVEGWCHDPMTYCTIPFLLDRTHAVTCLP